MKKRIISLVLLGISVLTVTACAALQAQSQRMAEKIIRLHVVANSDSDVDQAVKLRVRDAVLREAQNVLSDASDAKQAITAQLPALCELGAQVGSDVPFCVMGGTALVEGKGELLTRLPPAPEFFVVICKPDFSVSTPELYQALDETFIEKRPDQKVMQLNLQKGDLLGIGGSLCNVFEPVVMQKHFDINYIRSMMYTYGAYGAQMTGSGSAVFGIYDSFEYATVACTMLKDKYSQIFLAKTV